jgi:hypothetical protein
MENEEQNFTGSFDAPGTDNKTLPKIPFGQIPSEVGEILQNTQRTGSKKILVVGTCLMVVSIVVLVVVVIRRQF